MKLFIDECLSCELVHRAIARGHEETTSVAYRGLAGTKDWNLVPIVLAGDYTLVTKNSVDFRGAADRPGEKGLYKRVDVHPGLICLNGPKGMDLNMQIELFDIALDEIDRLNGDLVNKCLEVSISAAGDDIEITVYELPETAADAGGNAD